MTCNGSHNTIKKGYNTPMTCVPRQGIPLWTWFSQKIQIRGPPQLIAHSNIMSLHWSRHRCNWIMTWWSNFHNCYQELRVKGRGGGVNQLFSNWCYGSGIPLSSLYTQCQGYLSGDKITSIPEPLNTCWWQGGSLVWIINQGSVQLEWGEISGGW